MPKIYVGDKTASLANDAGKTDVHMQKTEIRSLSLVLCKNQLRIDQRY
jgi:hypothetical protein